MNSCVNLWQYLPAFVLEWETFRTEVVEKFKTNFMFKNCFPKIVSFLDKLEKYGTAKQVVHYNIMWRMRWTCWITKARKHTLKLCNTRFFSTAEMVTQMPLNICYAYVASLVGFLTGVFNG